MPRRIDRGEPLHLLLDSTDLKICGEGEWLDQKHGIRSRRRWRKLHLGIGADTHGIIAVELALDDVGDITEVPDLLNQIDVDVASITAVGAYDGEVVYDVVAERHPEAAIIIPPRITSVPNETTARQCNKHLAMIAEHRRMSWQRSSGYKSPEFGRDDDIATRSSLVGDFTPRVYLGPVRNSTLGESPNELVFCGCNQG